MASSAQNEFVIIGHRGAAGLVAENTLPSFAYAFDLGLRAVELDVHRVEGQLAVIHDDTLNRTTDRQGPVAALGAADLRLINAGGASIPVLDQVVDLAQQYATNTSPIVINIELKGQNTAEPVADFLRQSYPGIRALVSSFDHAQLRTFRNLDKQTDVAVLYHRWQDNWRDTASELNARAVNLNTRICTQARIKTIRQAGFRVYVYTVNRWQRAARLAQWGVNGVFTDRPDKMIGRSFST